MGYIENKKAFEKIIKEDIINNSTKNVEAIDLKENPEYELKLVNRTEGTNEEQIAKQIEEDVVVTYKYYEISSNNNVIESVNSIEDAEELVNAMKQEKQSNELDLSIIERYTKNVEDVTTNPIEIAKKNLETEVNSQLEEIQKQKEEQERINSLPDVEGIKLATVPVSGTITSRYGVSSRIRSSNHTGLDIAATTGTPIKVVADGIVTCASNNGAYGNLVKIKHSNDVETWYAHTSKMYVIVGQKVIAGEVIATVGSTGNSTGPHLHFEIRVNGNHVNPQKYLYK